MHVKDGHKLCSLNPKERLAVYTEIGDYTRERLHVHSVRGYTFLWLGTLKVTYNLSINKHVYIYTCISIQH